MNIDNIDTIGMQEICICFFGVSLFVVSVLGVILMLFCYFLVSFWGVILFEVSSYLRCHFGVSLSAFFGVRKSAVAFCG